MTTSVLRTLLLTICVSACAVEVVDEAEAGDVAAAELALEADEHLVALRTATGHYLTAENSGGSTISANRTAIGPWERFIMKHQWEDEVETGDWVQLRIADGSGKWWWMVADNNGGGPGSILRMNRTAPSYWETFRIWKPTGDDDILSGDKVHFEAATPGYYVCAEGGGGRSGDGSVVVNRTQALSWETFTIIYL